HSSRAVSVSRIQRRNAPFPPRSARLSGDAIAASSSTHTLRSRLLSPLHDGADGEDFSDASACALAARVANRQLSVEIYAAVPRRFAGTRQSALAQSVRARLIFLTPENGGSAGRKLSSPGLAEAVSDFFSRR